MRAEALKWLRERKTPDRSGAPVSAAEASRDGLGLL
jgi:hypothetical protein